MSLAACSREGSSHWTRHLNCCSSASRPCLDQPDRAGCAIRHSVRETNRHRRRAAKRTQYPFRSGAPREAGQRAVNARATTGRRHACGQKAARQRWLQSVSACWENWSGRWDSNPRPQPWQGCALPLSYTRTPNHRSALNFKSVVVICHTSRLVVDRAGTVYSDPQRHGRN